MECKKVGILTAGGLAPCLSSAIASLIERYNDVAPHVDIICYKNGYAGLLRGDTIHVTQEMRKNIALLHLFGGSPIGNSRVKLTNVADCVKRKLVKEGEDPQKVAAEQLVKDNIDVLHTIGGDDTNTAAADLAKFLSKNNYNLTVIGMPKTVDNDVIPIAQSLGADTAADEGAKFFENIVAEHSANPRMLIIHEIMGRHCGWLTVATALAYRKRLLAKHLLPDIGVSRQALDIHGVYIPEQTYDIDRECERLKKIMDAHDCVNVFVSEGANVDAIVEDMRRKGENVPTDAFGHVKLDAINPGKWFADQFAKKCGAEKQLIQKSGYFSRSAPANETDRRIIHSFADLAVECALKGVSGVIGHDEDRGNMLRAIEFERIKGGKPYDIKRQDYRDLLSDIGQTLP